MKEIMTIIAALIVYFTFECIYTLFGAVVMRNITPWQMAAPVCLVVLCAGAAMGYMEHHIEQLEDQL